MYHVYRSVYARGDTHTTTIHLPPNHIPSLLLYHSFDNDYDRATYPNIDFDFNHIAKLRGLAITIIHQVSGICVGSMDRE
jgi:hypothetical protein